MVVGNDCNPIGNLGLPNPMDIRFHQSAADLLALVLGKHSQRVNGNGTAALFVAHSMAILKCPTLVLPVVRKAHRSIGYAGLRSSRGNDMPHKSRARSGRLVLVALFLLIERERGQGEEAQTEFGAPGETIDELPHTVSTSALRPIGTG